MKVHAEGRQEIVRTSAENYGGVLDGIKREFADFRQETRAQADDIKGVLATHNQRISALEARR